MTTATSGRFRSTAIEGEYVRYDGTNAAEIAAFAGEQYVGADETGRPVVRSQGGRLHCLDPGWVVSRRDGAAYAVVSSPAAWAERAQEVA